MKTKYVIGLVIALVIGFLIGHGFPEAKKGLPVEVGIADQNLDGAVQFLRRTDSGDPTYPMFVQKHLDGRPMWGFILVSDFADVKHITNDLGMQPVIYGNFMDNRYKSGPWLYPIWDVSSKRLIDPLSGNGWVGKPEFFYVPVWLDGRS